MGILSIGVVEVSPPLPQMDGMKLLSWEQKLRLAGENFGFEIEAIVEGKRWWNWVDEEELEAEEVMSKVIVENRFGETWFGGDNICLALSSSNWWLKLTPLSSVVGAFPKDAELWLVRWDVEEPDNSMEAAAEVVEAMAVAETARGWLCVPSYVVIKMDKSSAHLCTWSHTCIKFGVLLLNTSETSICIQQ